MTLHSRCIPNQAKDLVDPRIDTSLEDQWKATKNYYDSHFISEMESPLWVFGPFCTVCGAIMVWDKMFCFWVCLSCENIVFSERKENVPNENASVTRRVVNDEMLKAAVQTFNEKSAILGYRYIIDSTIAKAMLEKAMQYLEPAENISEDEVTSALHVYDTVHTNRTHRTQMAAVLEWYKARLDHRRQLKTAISEEDVEKAGNIYNDAVKVSRGEDVEWWGAGIRAVLEWGRENLAQTLPEPTEEEIALISRAESRDRDLVKSILTTWRTLVVHRSDAPSNEFMECDECRLKPGTATLCAGCLHNREVINRLRGAIQEKKQ